MSSPGKNSLVHPKITLVYSELELMYPIKKTSDKTALCKKLGVGLPATT